MTITSITPASVVADAAFTLTVNGTGFVPASVVSRQSSAPLVTTFVSATQLTAAVPVTATASAGNVANSRTRAPTYSAI